MDYKNIKIRRIGPALNIFYWKPDTFCWVFHRDLGIGGAFLLLRCTVCRRPITHIPHIAHKTPLLPTDSKSAVLQTSSGYLLTPADLVQKKKNMDETANRSAAGIPDLLSNSGIAFRTRNYQLEMLEASRQGNVIIAVRLSCH